MDSGFLVVAPNPFHDSLDRRIRVSVRMAAQHCRRVIDFQEGSGEAVAEAEAGGVQFD